MDGLSAAGGHVAELHELHELGRRGPAHVHPHPARRRRREGTRGELGEGQRAVGEEGRAEVRGGVGVGAEEEPAVGVDEDQLVGDQHDLQLGEKLPRGPLGGLHGQPGKGFHGRLLDAQVDPAACQEGHQLRERSIGHVDVEELPVVEAGAQLVEVPAAPYRKPNNYVRYSGRLAEALNEIDPNGAVWANQFDNVANRQAHIETTGPEIWKQTDGKVDGFVAAVGSGGTLAGVGMALQPKGVKVALADPMGSGVYSLYKDGEAKPEGGSITEGIGQGRITANLDGFTPDMLYQISDQEALPYVFDLLKDEGLCMGGSSGINIAGAVRMARELGPGHTIVTILCDYGTRYQSKLFNPDFLRDKGLPVPDWMGAPPASIPGVFVDS